jgi:hypothetical protein
VPSVAPFAIVQTPPQQSVWCAQTSPDWPQKDEALQWPALQRPEQHSASVAHALFNVLQFGLSATQEPFVQVPLQHSPALLHAAPSDVHAPRLQTPPEQTPVQHSPALVHAAPSFSQPPPVPPTMTPVLEDPPVPVPVPEPTVEPEAPPAPCETPPAPCEEPVPEGEPGALSVPLPHAAITPPAMGIVIRTKKPKRTTSCLRIVVTSRFGAAPDTAGWRAPVLRARDEPISNHSENPVK